jgi:hypothetical protein
VIRKTVLVSIIALFSLCCFSPLFSAESVFFPDRGILFPDSMESENQDIGHILSNPARIQHTDTKPTLKLENTPSFVGYNQLSVSGLYPFREWTFFAGYLYLGNSTLEHTVRDSITNRPIRSGQFAHSYQQVTMGSVYHIPKTTLRLSSNVEWDAQSLDGDQVSGIGLGAGLHWGITTQLWTSLYIHRLITPTWTWSADYTESLDRRILFAAGYTDTDWQTSMDTDGSLARIRGEYAIGDYLSIFGDMVAADWQSIRRSGLGVSLHLSPLRIHYTHLLFSETSLNADHDIFGVSITL